MRISLIEIKTGKVITKKEIVIGGKSDNPSERDCFEKVWTAAVKNKLVNTDERNNYSFLIE